MRCKCGTDDIIEYDLCKKCIKTNIKICVCNKRFTESPKVIKIEDNYYNIPEELPYYFFTLIKDNYYGIKSCGACSIESFDLTTGDPLKNLDKILSITIPSCVFSLDTNKFTYVSDTICPELENLLNERGIKVGDVENIIINK